MSTILKIDKMYGEEDAFNKLKEKFMINNSDCVYIELGKTPKIIKRISELEAKRNSYYSLENINEYGIVLYNVACISQKEGDNKYQLPLTEVLIFIPFNNIICVHNEDLFGTNLSTLIIETYNR